MSATWGMSDMKAALSQAANGHQDGHKQNIDNNGGGLATQRNPKEEFSQDWKAKGWQAPEAYNYDADENTVGWESNAVVYYWDGEEGDIGPVYPELENILFGSEEDRKEIRGIDFTKIAEIEVVQEGPTRIQPIDSFKNAGLHPAMLRNVELAGYCAPTPIQKFTLPAVHLGYDVIGIAQTGSGKTAAYMIPILNKLMGKAKKLAAKRPNPADCTPGLTPHCRAEPLVVIVCPARELAVQIFNEARKFCYRTMLRPCVVYGGGPLRDQIGQLGKGCDVLIATPGRLVDLIQRPDVLTLRRLRYMVIDEADEMLQDDWGEEFGQILSGGEQDEGNVKYMLFSATFPKAARELAKTHLNAGHVRFRVGRAGSTVENIKQTVMKVENPEKKAALIALLGGLAPCRTIIFVNSKRMADEIDDFLFNMGLPCTSMHSDRTQLEREAAMRAFRKGSAPLLIATGVTARGIDVRNVRHVINYDLPSMEHGGIEEYVHRIGRTGRMGHLGVATSFYTERDEPIASVLTRTLLETGQEVPEFLEQYKPQGDALNNLKFEVESDWDEHEAAMTGGAGGSWDNAGGEDASTWGASGGDSAAANWGGNNEANSSGNGNWGTASSGNGWGAATSDGWGNPPSGNHGDGKAGSRWGPSGSGGTNSSWGNNEPASGW